jgi:hypothetical protein
MIKLSSLLKEEESAEEKVKTLITKVSNYSEFVKQLGSLAGDPKVQAFIKAGKKDGSDPDDMFTATAKAIPVKQLRPTQNEIDVKGSLFWPLTKVDSMKKCMSSGPITIKAPVVTYNGQWIIDGHHRWSQLYAMNQDGQINCLDLKGPKMNPIDVLKIVQMAIAADLGKVPVASVKGQNLLKMPPPNVKKYVKSVLQKDCAEIMLQAYASKQTEEPVQEGNADKSQNAKVANIVGKNVESMQKTGIPTPGAPKRDVMPQTDDATNAIPMIGKGQINYNEPYSIQEVSKQIHKVLQEELKKIRR